jgi:hypothetical protein
VLSCNYHSESIKQSEGAFVARVPGAPKHGPPPGPSGRLHVRASFALIVIYLFNFFPEPFIRSPCLFARMTGRRDPKKQSNRDHLFAADAYGIFSIYGPGCEPWEAARWSQKLPHCNPSRQNSTRSGDNIKSHRFNSLEMVP